MARLQSEMAAAAGRLLRICRIRYEVSEQHFEAVRRGLQGLEEEDELLGILDGYECCLVQDLQVQGIPNEFDWLSIDLSNDFVNASSLLLGPSLPSSFSVGENPLGGAAHG